MIGKKILGYTIDEKVGSGASGTVYKVSKTNASGKYVRALKHIVVPSEKQYEDILHSMGGDYAKADYYFADVLKEIINEIQVISALSEAGIPNIVRYYENDIVETGLRKKTYDIYILMEYLTPFIDHLHQHVMTVRDVICLGKDILAALAACHARRVIHRDIKDDNIFVGTDGTFKLGDFGLSKKLKDQSRAESMKGTPNFIAPEIFLHREQYDETVDVYSLGVVLYRLLNKSRNPFLPEFPIAYGSQDESEAFGKRMMGERPGLPYDAKNHLGEVVVTAILEKNQRYHSAQEFLNALNSTEASLRPEELEKPVNQELSNSMSCRQNGNFNAELEKTVCIFQEKFSGENAGQKKQYGNSSVSSAVSQEQRTSSSFIETSMQAELEEPDETQGLTQSIAAEESYNPSKKERHVEEYNEPLGYQMSFFDKQYQKSQSDILKRTNRISRSRSNIPYLAYLLPVFFAGTYFLTSMVFLPCVFGKAVSTIQWMFRNSIEIGNMILEDQQASISVGNVVAIKVILWISGVCFIASLFYLGKALQNKETDYHPDAVMRDREPYIKAMGLNERIGNKRDLSKAKTAIVSVMERLRNESDFGYGDSSVIACENKIFRSLEAIEGLLETIEGSQDAPCDKECMEKAADTIVAQCETILSKLRLRMELKKK